MSHSHVRIHPVVHFSSVLLLALFCVAGARSQTLAPGAKLVPVGSGFAVIHVNATSFGRHALTTVGQTQYIAFYNETTNVVVGTRTLGTTNWQFLATTFRARRNGSDDHECISIAVDGRGYLHCSWGMHASALKYARSPQPWTLSLVQANMTGAETAVTYPQFINLPNGDLLYLFREGGSGNGNTVVNRWSHLTQTWTRLPMLINGNLGNNNAYPNFVALDSKTNLHMTWSWRDTPDFYSNHDVLYARSPDFGVTWKRWDDSTYALPMNLTNAEVILPIATNNWLVNSTGMAIDRNDRPIVATWWAPAGDGRTQIMSVWNDGSQWRISQVTQRSFGGWWMNRPIIVVDKRNRAFIVYTDDERGGVPTLAYTADPSRSAWALADLSSQSLGTWEPIFDPQLWDRDNKLHLLYQAIGTGANPSPVSVLEFEPEVFLPVSDWKDTVATGYWSQPSNWTNPPGSGGSTPAALSFNTATALTATNDLAGSLRLYYLALNGKAPGSITLAGNPLIFTNYGALKPTITSSSTAAARLDNSLTLAANLTVAFSSTGSVTFTGPLSGAGSLHQCGPGQLLLTRANSQSYAGGTWVEGGTIGFAAGAIGKGNITLQNGSLVSLDSALLQVGSGIAATLTGNGKILGPVSIAAQGTLAPGSATIGELAISNRLVLAGTTVMKLNAATHSNDRVYGITTATFGGSLVVTNVAGALAAGDRFTLFQANTYQGAFASVSLPPLPNGMHWDTSGLGRGVLAVSQSPLWGWGDNSAGQRDLPLMATNVLAISAGAWHSLALQADGTVLAWGDGSLGQCNIPPSLTNAVAIAAGGYHNLALQADGTVLAWGNNGYGQATVPPGLKQVFAIACGTWHSLALRRDGTVVAWGSGFLGQSSVPVNLSNVVAIAAGGNHSLALKADGTVAAWGENTNSRGTFSGQSVVPAGLANVVAIGAGDYHSLAVRANGTVVAWGDNSEGQCTVPPTLTNAVAVFGGGAHSLALQADGRAIGWGANGNGQCNVPALTDVAGLGAGEYHSIALVANGLSEPRLLSPLWQASRFSVLVQSLARKSYALDYRNALNAVWTPLSTNTGNGSLKLLNDPLAVGPQRLYRVRQW